MTFSQHSTANTYLKYIQENKTLMNIQVKSRTLDIPTGSSIWISKSAICSGGHSRRRTRCRNVCSYNLYLHWFPIKHDIVVSFNSCHSILPPWKDYICCSLRKKRGFSSKQLQDTENPPEPIYAKVYNIPLICHFCHNVLHNVSGHQPQQTIPARN